MCRFYFGLVILSEANHKHNVKSNLPAVASPGVGKYSSWFRDFFHHMLFWAMGIRETCSLYFGNCAIYILLNTEKTMLQSMN